MKDSELKRLIVLGILYKTPDSGDSLRDLYAAFLKRLETGKKTETGRPSD